MIAREIDYPPIWLAAFAILGLTVGRMVPVRLPYADEVGGLLVALALTIMLAAVLQMLRWRTTVIPGRNPRHLLTHGLFGLSRNPIYAADVLFLAGLFIFWDALVAFPLIPLFMYLIYKRFIRDEEARLLHLFGEQYDDYKNRTRRWI